MKIALGVTGCIAAYKAIEVMRGLQKAGITVQVVLTRSAREFVTPLTFEALSGQPVITSMFRRGSNREIQHTQLAQEIDLLAVVPATANILGKFARGIADDFLSTFYLSSPSPVLLAPAMNVEMWKHAAVRDNVEILRARGHDLVLPQAGRLACGTEGVGRLAEVEAIVSAILLVLNRDRSMAGVRVLVTAGPTVEDIDPVRFISNRSSGKMGYAVAEAAARRGAEVLLVSGPTHLGTPHGVEAVMVRSAEEMRAAVMARYDEMDIVVKAAAVADFRPAECAPSKIKKEERKPAIALEPTEDILAALGRVKAGQVLVGFAMETEALVENARKKLASKNLDLIVANDIASGIFGSDTATVYFLAPGTEDEGFEHLSKSAIAGHLLDRAMHLRARRRNAGVVSTPKAGS